MKKILTFVVAATLIGCATKRYPIATPMVDAEADQLTCEQLQLEMVRADQVESQINETAEFDGRTVLGGLGDLGIGNRMAQKEARQALADRRRSIRAAQLKKGCSG